MVLRKPGSYIDGFPAQITSQVQTHDAGHHIIVGVSVLVQYIKLAGIICASKGLVLLRNLCVEWCLEMSF